MPAKCRGKSLSKTLVAYDDDNPVLNINGVEFSEDRSAIVGPIGSGKSTLLKIIAGLYQPSFSNLKSTILMLLKFTLTTCMKILSTSQDVRLFNGSLRENLILGVGNVTDEKIIEARKPVRFDY